MTGKIFPDSANIYQDQAKILFNYYRQAAEKIVLEEERIETEIASLKEDKIFLKKRLSRAKYLWILFFLIVPIFIYFVRKNGLKKELRHKNSRIHALENRHDAIFRNYKVSKLGVAYIPVASQVTYGNKSFIVDHTGQVNPSEVTLQLPRENDLLIQTIAGLKNLSSEAPVVETSAGMEAAEADEYSRSMPQMNRHDYFGKLERSLQTLSHCLDDLDSASVSLPLVAEGSEYLAGLREYATAKVPEGAPVIDVFDREKYAGSLSRFRELNKLRNALSDKTTPFEDVLKGLMMTIARSVQALSALKVASSNKIIGESNDLLYKILKAPYNHYSPVLEASEIERIRNETFNYAESAQGYEPFCLKQSSRVKYNLLTGAWMAEDGGATRSPFGIHQIYEEIVAPVVQNLLNENREERLKIYNHIKDLKTEYLDKWRQDADAFYRANRAESVDIINLMQRALKEYVAACHTLFSYRKTESDMVRSQGSPDEATAAGAVDPAAETMAAFELQSKEFQRIQTGFEDYMERLKEDIDLKAERFGHMEYFDAKLRDGHFAQAALAAAEAGRLDARRKPLAAVNPLFAKVAELPPPPAVEDIVFEHISLNLPDVAWNALNELNQPDAIAEEDTPEKDTPDEEKKQYAFDEEELNEMPDEILKQILNEMNLAYDAENFNREQAVEDILDFQDDNNE
jgi:hypothetical protein